MPKVKSLRAKAVKHLSAPKSKVNDVLEDPTDREQSAVEPTAGILTKKEKRHFKREAFQGYVTESIDQASQSKSAIRRAKRRDKERLAADMSDMSAVLRTVIQDSSLPVDPSSKDSAAEHLSRAKPQSKGSAFQIGRSGATKPLSKQQKKRTLELEQRRLPLILSHPEFMKDPFGTIRTHTSHVLAKTDSTN